MNERQAVQVVCELHVDTRGQVGPEEFHGSAVALMDELVKLDGCVGNEELLDPTVSSDAGRKVITVEVLVVTRDPVEAVQEASTMVRSALHAAGANTAGWPRVTRMDNTTEHIAAIPTA